VPRTRTITYESQRFAVSGPRVWNDLPPTLCASSTTKTHGQFQSRLKTTLFRLAYGTRLSTFVIVWAIRIAPYKCSNILHTLFRLGSKVVTWLSKLADCHVDFRVGEEVNLVQQA